MITMKKMPYEAPLSNSIRVAGENAICQASTNESFNQAIIYGSDWEEED